MINQVLIKFFLYAIDPYEAKCQSLINKRESVSLNYINDSKAFIDCSYNMDDIDKNIEEYSPNRKKNIDCSSSYDCWYA